MTDTATIPDAPWVVGLDLSLTSTGVAYADGRVEHLDTKALRGPERLDYVRAAVCQALDCWDSGPDLVVIEGYSYGSPNGAASAGELGGLIRWEVWRQGITFAVVAPGQLKKYATGRGDADKTAMVVAARERLGYDGLDDDEADALWLRALGADLEGAPLVALPKANRRILDAVARQAGRAGHVGRT